MPPLRRSLTFWSGFVACIAIIAAWMDSIPHQGLIETRGFPAKGKTLTLVSRSSATHWILRPDDTLVLRDVFHRLPALQRLFPSGFLTADRSPLSPGVDAKAAYLFPPVDLFSGEYGSDHRIAGRDLPIPAAYLDTVSSLVIPYWLLLISVLLPWCAALLLRRRRRRKARAMAELPGSR